MHGRLTLGRWLCSGHPPREPGSSMAQDQQCACCGENGKWSEFDSSYPCPCSRGHWFYAIECVRRFSLKPGLSANLFLANVNPQGLRNTSSPPGGTPSPKVLGLRDISLFESLPKQAGGQGDVAFSPFGPLGYCLNPDSTRCCKFLPPIRSTSYDGGAVPHIGPMAPSLIFEVWPSRRGRCGTRFCCTLIAPSHSLHAQRFVCPSFSLLPPYQGSCPC